MSDISDLVMWDGTSVIIVYKMQGSAFGSHLHGQRRHHEVPRHVRHLRGVPRTVACGRLHRELNLFIFYFLREGEFTIWRLAPDKKKLARFAKNCAWSIRYLTGLSINLQK